MCKEEGAGQGGVSRGRRSRAWRCVGRRNRAGRRVRKNTNTNTNNLFPPIPSDTVMFIYDNYDNKYDNTMSYSCLLLKMFELITMSLWIWISCSHFS